MVNIPIIDIDSRGESRIDMNDFTIYVLGSWGPNTKQKKDRSLSLKYYYAYAGRKVDYSYERSEVIKLDTTNIVTASKEAIKKLGKIW